MGSSDAIPVTTTRLRLPWAAVLVVASAMLGGAVWVTNVQRDVSGLIDSRDALEVIVREIREDQIRIMERLGVPRTPEHTRGLVQPGG